MTAQLDMVTWLDPAEPPSPVLLHRIEPERNMRRFYALAIEPTLFGEFALVTHWGRMRAPRGQMQTRSFPTIGEAEQAMEVQARGKIRRGYFRSQ